MLFIVQILQKKSREVKELQEISHMKINVLVSGSIINLRRLRIQAPNSDLKDLEKNIYISVLKPILLREVLLYYYP